jgi:hypothetical protein
MRLEVLTTADVAAWSDALARAGRHDFHHEAWYHALAEHGGTRAELIVAEHRGATLAVPLLFRPIQPQPGTDFDGLEDATSVYGYPGPVGPGSTDPTIVTELAAACGAYLRARGTVSLFSRLHPLLDQSCVVEPGEVVEAGVTASIDTSRTIEQMWSDTRSGHRNGINRLRRAGFTCEPRGAAALDTFVDVYESTMRRLDAGSHYFFSREHYEALVDPARAAMELFVVADPEGTPAAVGLFSVRCDIAQYHLSGATEEHRRHAPTTLLIDEARRWAKARGATQLHLGGGLGGARDSLFDFKTGFGTGRHTFRLWKRVLRPDVYLALAEHRARNRPPADPQFFPSYRAP